MEDTLEKAQLALQFNKDRGLYSEDADYLRVYASFKGGIYDKQRTSIKSLAMLEKYIEEGQELINIEVVSTSKAWADYFKGMSNATI